MTIHPRIITRHAEDAAFYWARRMEGVLAPQHDLRSLGRFEVLLHANLEGLCVAQHESSTVDASGQVLEAGCAGWQANFRRVKLWKTADETFVAATLALASATAQPLALLEAMACDQFDEAAGTAVPMARGLSSAAGWLPWDAVSPSVLSWAASSEPVLRRCALSALALHRMPAGDALSCWLQDPHPMVRARALRAVGELGQADLAGELGVALGAPAGGDACSDAWGCRTAAAQSLCLLGTWCGAADVAGEMASHMANARSSSPIPRDRMRLVAAWAQVAPAAQLQSVIESALQQRAQWGLALAAMRFSGDARWLDALVQVMEHQCSAEPVLRFFTEPASNLARHAADVFAHITGARIGDQLWRPVPEPDPGSADEAQAGDAASNPRIPVASKQDPDDGLLWPDVDAIKRWWGSRRTAFSAGGAHHGRYLAGLALQSGSAARVLVDPVATQLQRHHAALYLRCAGHTAQLFDVSASLPTQRARADALGLVLASF